MERSEIQKLVRVADPTDGANLPEDFGSEVLRRGRRLRFFMKRHWRLLRIASLISLLIAIALGITLSRMATTDSQPPLLLFQGSPEANPFSTE